MLSFLVSKLFSIFSGLKPFSILFLSLLSIIMI
jgi:hypothetical protein